MHDIVRRTGSPTLSPSGASRPSYNIAVMKCQIDAAPLTSHLSHVSHMPSNRTPATRV